MNVGDFGRSVRRKGVAGGCTDMTFQLRWHSILRVTYIVLLHYSNELYIYLHMDVLYGYVSCYCLYGHDLFTVQHEQLLGIHRATR